MTTTTHKGKGNGKRKGKPLNDKFVERAKTPGKYSDGQHGGNGLMLWIQRSGSRQWVQRIVIHGKRRDIGLGGYPIVSLKQARDRALANRQIALAGGDPRTQAKPGVPTFEDATRKVHGIHAATWKNDKQRAQWIDEVSRIVWPSVGHLPVDAITTAQLTAVFEPIWLAKPVIANRVRQRTERIFDWVVSQRFRADNPAAAPLKANLPKQPKGGHQEAIHHAEVAGAIEAVRNSTSGDMARSAFEFLVLTATRKSETLEARWDEIDLEARTWVIPGSRMKAGREHRVPLSKQATGILARCEKGSGGRTGYVFGRGKPLDGNTLNKMLAKVDVKASPHGFRASFKSWAMDTGQNHLATEFALAHSIADKTEAAYVRSDLFEDRGSLMQDWADYVSG